MKDSCSKNINSKIQDVARNVFTVKNFVQKNAEKGAWPSSEATVWALRAGAPENGFGDAFITVGCSRRVLIDEEKFWAAVRRFQEEKNASK